MPMVQHIGSGGRPLPRQFHDNGLVVTDFLGGGENVRSKDFMSIHMSTELFFSCMILDGVLDRFPGLRVGSIEQGASWVVAVDPPALDQVMSFSRTEPRLRELSLKTSEFVHRQMRFTPWPTSHRGMIEQAGDDLFLFSSGYPHPGARGPDRPLRAQPRRDPGRRRDRFYAQNLADLLGVAVPAAG